MDSIFLKSPLQRIANFLGFVLVMMSLAVAAQAAERSLGRPSRALSPQELVVTSNLTDQEVEPTFALTLTLSRPLSSTEGRLAVLIGRMDISNLLAPAGDNDSLSYLPRVLPLPAGESPVKVFLVTPSDEWREITQLTLRVKTPEQTGGQAETAKTAAAKKYRFTPSLTLGMKSQMAESHFPDSNRPARPTFADMTMQASMKSEVTTGWFSNQMQFDVAGSSFRQDALRFSDLGDKAPKVDLSSYQTQFQLNQLVTVQSGLEAHSESME